MVLTSAHLSARHYFKHAHDKRYVLLSAQSHPKWDIISDYFIITLSNYTCFPAFLIGFSNILLVFFFYPGHIRFCPASHHNHIILSLKLLSYCCIFGGWNLYKLALFNFCCYVGGGKKILQIREKSHHGTRVILKRCTFHHFIRLADTGVIQYLDRCPSCKKKNTLPTDCSGNPAVRVVNNKPFLFHLSSLSVWLVFAFELTDRSMALIPLPHCAHSFEGEENDPLLYSHTHTNTHCGFLLHLRCPQIHTLSLL